MDQTQWTEWPNTAPMIYGRVWLQGKRHSTRTREETVGTVTEVFVSLLATGSNFRVKVRQECS